MARLWVRSFDQHAEHRLAWTPHTCLGPRPVGHGVQPRCLRCRSLARLSGLDLALLERTLDLSIRMHAKMHPRPDSSAFVRLDHYSGLFLERGAAEGQWMLQARTWGHPAPQSVHEWHLVAAGGAHQLDPTVTLPKRLCASAPDTPDRQLGRAANKRLARIRRHMVGLQ